jgi:hypothetical protein
VLHGQERKDSGASKDATELHGTRHFASTQNPPEADSSAAGGFLHPAFPASLRRIIFAARPQDAVLTLQNTADGFAVRQTFRVR